MKKLVLLFLISFSLSASSQDVIHVIVALCDNDCQGIVPVNDRIGDGSNPDANLYWGCGYGVRNFFDKKTSAWTLLDKSAVDEVILERLVFRHDKTGTILVA